jgi:hypothetical protein
MFTHSIRKIVGAIFHLFLFFGKDDFRNSTSMDKLHKECIDITAAYLRHGEETVSLLHIIVAANLFCMQLAKHQLYYNVQWQRDMRRQLKLLITATAPCC